MKRGQFIRRMRLGLEDARSLSPATRPRFLTLTSPGGETFEDSAAVLSRRFEHLRRIVWRETGRRIEYAGVVERGTRGERKLHLHLVIRGPWIAQQRWSTWAVRAGLGRVVDIRAVQSAALASYAAKALGGYLTKAAGDDHWPRHFRRLRVSSDWAPAWIVHKPTGSGDWAYMGMEPAWEPRSFVDRLVSAAQLERSSA